MTDTRTASSKNADLTNDQIEFAIEYLSAHAKQAETGGFFRVCGRDLTAIAELRTEQADRALAWTEAQSNRVIQPVTNRDATLAEGYEVAFKVVEVTL